MPFPESPKFHYKKNPLDRVICQIRFPPILKIDAESPSKFQELIRSDFPLYVEKQEILPSVSTQLGVFPQQNALGMIPKPAVLKNHEFQTEDGTCIINLTRTFVSLTTTKYVSWSLLKPKIDTIIIAVREAYSIPFATRIGIRYIDIFDRERLGVESHPWSELLKTECIGVLGSEFEQNVLSSNSTFEIELADKVSRCRIATSMVLNMQSQKKCFMLDSDFSTPQKTNYSDLNAKLDFLHLRASRLLRWVVKEPLHLAMDPK